MDFNILSNVLSGMDRQAAAEHIALRHFISDCSHNFMRGV